VRTAPTPDRLASHIGWPLLDEVISSLDSEVLRVVRAPSGDGVRVSDAVIHDPVDPHSLQAGAIVLGVGLSARDRDVVSLVEACGRCAAPALIVRSDDEVPDRLMEAADSWDVALLTAPPEMTWGQLYSLLRTAIVSAGAVGHGDAAGIPVGDLFALADAIAAAVGGAVTIEDPQWRVLAYSNLDHPIDEARRQTILGRTPTAVWQKRLEDAGVAQALRKTGGIVRFEGFEDEGLAPRLAAAVHAGSELLGSIWVVSPGDPLGPTAEGELERAAELAAIHIISLRASEDIKRRTRGAFVREVLEGRIPTASSLADFPLRTDGPFTVLAFEVPGSDSPSRSGVAERILSIVSLYCEDLHPDAMCAVVADRFWALVPTPQRTPRERTLEVARKIVDRVERSVRVPLRAGIGASVAGVTDVPKSRRAAEQALEILAKQQPGSAAVHIEDVRPHAVLLELLDLVAKRPALLQGKLDILIAHDEDHDHRTSYVETLRAYFEAGCDAGKAARRLGVHVNTLRYRVRRLVELSGLDLDDPDERFVTELQLRSRAHLGARRQGPHVGDSDNAGPPAL
jgi:hypothetical protein